MREVRTLYRCRFVAVPDSVAVAVVGTINVVYPSRHSVAVVDAVVIYKQASGGVAADL